VRLLNFFWEENSGQGLSRLQCVVSFFPQQSAKAELALHVPIVVCIESGITIWQQQQCIKLCGNDGFWGGK
jgi:hypothetical protein